MLLSISEFIGHFHPLLVHLPIGILLIGLLLLYLSGGEKYKGIREVLPVVFFSGMLAAILSCITGYVLSINDDYDKTTVSWHQWMGITVALVSIVLFFKIRHAQLPVNSRFLAVILLLLIFITGHLGGSLTHGSDYLTKPLADIFRRDSVSPEIIKPISNVQEAYVYNDIVRPIFQTRCFSCHGEKKQKGKLRMDDSIMLMQGGKDGKVIEPGNANRSAMIRRLLLPVDDEDHMPPKEKPQPSENQIVLLEWWINQGATFGKKVKELNRSANVNSILFTLQNANETGKKIQEVPNDPVEKADGSVIEKMKSRGVIVLPVSQNSHWLEVNFLTDTLVDKEELQGLLALKKQLIGLKLGNTNFSDSDMNIIAQLENLRSLDLQHTKITDKGLQAIMANQHLQYLNLVGTQVTLNGLLKLKGMKSLQSIYLFQTGIGKADWVLLHNHFPGTLIDTGGYFVPLLPTDTMVVKAKKEY